MRKAMRYGVWGLALAAALSLSARPARADSLGSKVVRGAAIGFAVKVASKPLDSFINTITLRHNMRSTLATKVVPILSVGEKGYVGGAQVSGPKSLVDQVQAVFQYEKNFSNDNYRAKILLPSASINPLELKRVAKVGVTAIIDVALDGGLRHHTVGTGIQTGDVIRGAAVLVAVKAAGPTINQGINAITFNQGAVTRFVPLGSFGEKAYLGGAQVSASSTTISQVSAVWQYEDLFDNGKFRVKVLVPASAVNPLQAKRVEGAGITAVVDMAVSEQRPEPSRRERYARNDSAWKTRPDDHRRRDDDDDDDKRRVGRHDNGKHLGWYVGKHKGWDKKGKKKDD